MTAATNTKVSLSETELYKIKLGIRIRQRAFIVEILFCKKRNIKKISSLLIKAREVMEEREKIGM